MTSALLCLLLAAPASYRVEGDLHGQADAVGATAALQWSRFSVSASGSHPPSLGDASAWAYGASGAVTHPVGPVLLGLRGGAGSAFDASLFGRLGSGRTTLTLDVGYRHTDRPILSDGRSVLVMGNSVNLSAKATAPLGLVTVYAALRFANGVGSYTYASPAISAGPAADPGANPACPPDASHANAAGSPTSPVDAATGLAEVPRALVPGVGLSLPVFEWASLYAEAEYFPGRGVQVAGGLTVSFERRAPPVTPPVSAPEPPRPTVPSMVEIHLTSQGSPIAGTVLVTGPRAFEVSVPAQGMAAVELGPGRWRLRFLAPGRLGREKVIRVVESTVTAVAEDLNPAPERRSVMLTQGGIRLFRPVEFLAGGTELSEASKAVLAEVADLLVNEPSRKVSVTAHVDRDGENDPDSLSQAQADSIVEFLGTLVAPERLSGVGAGAKQPLIPNLLNASRKLNRRVLFELN